MMLFMRMSSYHKMPRQYYHEKLTRPPPLKISYKILIILIIIVSGLYLLNFKSSTNFADEYHVTLMRQANAGNKSWLQSIYQALETANDIDENTVESQSYFVNTPGCRMPSFPVTNAEIRLYMHRPKRTTCPRSLTSSNDHHLWISMTASEIQKYLNVQHLDDLRCYYQAFQRTSDDTIQVYGELRPLQYGERVEINDEFVRVLCDYKNISKYHRDYHIFAPRKPWVDSRIRSKIKPGGLFSMPAPKKYSVMVFGLDSMSRLNFQRQMPKSHEFLKKQMGAFEFLGYNKIGDNTYPNLIPVLTGFSDKELEDTCLFRGKKSHYDLCYFIWKSFSEAGYLTNFSEDVNYLGLFNYFRQGFVEQPTDYTARPVFCEMESQIGSNKLLNIFMCLGGRHPFNIFIDYIKKFVNQFAVTPFFSFFWSTSMTHDDFNYGRNIDSEFMDFMKGLRRKVANNTILVIMSDHGMRWGEFRETYQGMMEERQPMLYIVLPQSFQNEYPLATENLKINKRRLTSHYDLYETLKDLANTSMLIKSELTSRIKEISESEPVPRGISLFIPIPKTRTCESAGIDDHWCTCHQKHIISTVDPRVQISARFIVKNINTMLEAYPQCQTLHLMSINEAVLLASNKNITKGRSTKNFADVTVRLVTKPGLGEFEGTIRLEPGLYDSNNILLTGTISRTNLYGKQSYCVDDYAMKLYCYCNR